MKILACCGSGLVSSFIIQKNVETVLKELNIKDAIIEVASVLEAKKVDADLYVGGVEIASQLAGLGKKIIYLNNIVDMGEVRTKVVEAINEMN